MKSTAVTSLIFLELVRLARRKISSGRFTPHESTMVKELICHLPQGFIAMPSVREVFPNEYAQAMGVCIDNFDEMEVNESVAWR
jgi:hypothetical protein